MESLFTKGSYYTAFVAFIIALWVTFSLSGEFWSSLAAAFLTSVLMWGTHLTIRMLLLSFKK